MIKSFKDKRAKAIFEGHHPGKGFPVDLIRPARRKLVMLAEAKALEDLRSPPRNHLEALKKDRAGQHSIRINDQWRGLLRLDRQRRGECGDRRLSLVPESMEREA